MSGLLSEPLRSDEQEFATLRHGDSAKTQRQRPNRPSDGFGSGKSVTMDDDGETLPEVEISAGQKMLSAVSGSLLTSLLVTPLDVVRVRLQSQPSSTFIPSRVSSSALNFTNLPPNLGVTACCREVFWVNNTSSVCMAADGSTTAFNTIAPSTSAAGCAVDETRRKTFNSTFDGLRKIARHEGVTTLWRGLSPTLAMAIPANVIYFTGYDYLRSSANSPIHAYVPDSYAPLIAGSIARIAAASVISPIEMFRTRMQAATSDRAGKGVFSETLKGLKHMVQVQGYTSLWRGLTLTMWRDVPFSGFYWWGYETVRNILADSRNPMYKDARHDLHLRSGDDHATTFIDSFIAGAASGAVAAIITTPFDVGKTRQQVLEHSHSSKSGPTSKLRPEERSMPRFLYQIWAEEGITGLFRGWAARCLKVAPACAIMISSYEIGKKMAKTMNEKKNAKVVV